MGSRRQGPGGLELALTLRPDAVLPLVNLSLVYARTGQNDQAEASLRQALQLEPGNAAANFNLGLLLAEQVKAGKPRSPCAPP